MPPKRKAAADVHTAATSKKFCTAIESLAEEWVCPITQELPLNPVTAEDGRVYERSAIANWLGRARPAEQPAKSPVTNEPMGPRLLPAPQVRNTIKVMVQSGALSGDKAAAWEARLEEVAEMRRQAEGGNGDAAWTFGRWYDEGENVAQGVQWHKRGADLGQAEASMVECALSYELVFGVARNDARALMYYSRAAEAGSARGCHYLGSTGPSGLLQTRVTRPTLCRQSPAAAQARVAR